MTFDKWFNSQSRLVQFILLIIPFVNWIVEFLVRLSIMIRKPTPLHIVMWILFTFVGWGYVFCIIDLIYLVIKGNLLFAE